MMSHKQNFVKTNRLKRTIFFKHTRQVLKNPMNFLGDLVKSHGSMVHATIATKKYIIIQNPESIKHILLNDHKLFHKQGVTKILRFFFGEGLVTSNGTRWQKKRRLIQPAFHKKRLNLLVSIINEETTALIDKLAQYPPNSSINISDEMLRLNVSIVNRALFSNAIDEDIKRMMEVLEELTAFATSWIKRPVKLPLSWPTPSNLRFRRNYKSYNDIIHGMIQRRRSYRLNTDNPAHDDLLDMLLDYVDEDGFNGLTDKQLRDDITTIFMAAHDTTAQSLSWIFYEIAKNEGIAEKLKTESTRICNDGEPELEQIASLKYTSQVIKEGLRCYPSIIAVLRKPIKDGTIGDTKITRKTNLLINIYGIHRHPDYWNDPERFDPDRFNDESMSSLNPYVYLPFGAGPRRCIGSQFASMVMQVVLSRFSTKFHFESPKDYTPIIEPNITIKAKDGILLRFNKI